MRADTTRDSYRPGRHYRHVLQQQGRVSLDAEWNEQRGIDDHLRHTALTDLLGRSAGPLDGPAFTITTDGKTVTIGGGRYYVDGMLLENDDATPLDRQPDLPPGLPAVLTADGSPLSPAAPGTYLAELDSWTRQVTALDDPGIREMAVPVPDTTTRAQTVWQVRLIRVGDPGATITRGQGVPAWSALRAPSTGTMKAQATAGEEAASPCEVPAGAGYRGLDNQHYRVEIRDGGSTGTATFLWSRENASVQARWTGQSGNSLTVSVPSRDAAIGFAAGDWIELVDDRTELGGLAGTLVRIATTHDDIIEIDPATRLPTTAVIDLTTTGGNPKVRRWEGPPQATATNWTPLEHGVEVAFGDNRTYRTGEYWSVPARTAIADVVWPKTGDTSDLVRPAGPAHRYTPLAMLSHDGTTWTVTEDRRALFPPLTSMVTLRYAGGDGQHAAPVPGRPDDLVALGFPLQVTVANGNRPVAGATVEFTVITGSGRVSSGNAPSGNTPSAAPGTTALAATDSAGLAGVTWLVDPTTASQTVRARLLGSGGAAQDVDVFFHATPLHADDVALAPSTCPTLTGLTNVQQALEALCLRDSTGCPTIVVTPTPGWTAPIRQLPPGSSARIHFWPGDYRLAEPLVLTDLADIALDGAGRGSRIVCETSETVLRFQNCRAVRIGELLIEAGLSVAPGPSDPGQSGAVTLTGCDSVEMHGTSITCADGTVRGSACVTVLGAGGGTRVKIRDCALAVGHLQTGVIIIDGSQVRVTDNVISGATHEHRRKRISLDRLLTVESRRRLLVGQLVGKPRLLGIADVESNGSVRIGPWTARLASAISPGSWAGLITANPPTDDDLKAPETVRRYLARLVKATIEQPAFFPAFARRLSDLRHDVGGEAFDTLLREPAGRSTVEAFLLGRSVDVSPANDRPGRRGTEPTRVVDLRLEKGHVEIESPVPPASWVSALTMLDAAGPANSTTLRNSLYRAARQALRDSEFRNTIDAFRDWYASVEARNVMVASAGVVCAGRLAEDVEVTGNRFLDISEAVHIAVSQDAPREAPPLYAGTVRVMDNEARLALPVELERGDQGIFVGNARRVTITRNTLATAVTDNPTYHTGVRVHGHLGARLAVDGNTTDGCAIGVRVTAVSGHTEPHSWLVRDNVAPSATTPVSVSPGVLESGNAGR